MTRTTIDNIELIRNENGVFNDNTYPSEYEYEISSISRSTNSNNPPQEEYDLPIIQLERGGGDHPPSRSQRSKSSKSLSKKQLRQKQREEEAIVEKRRPIIIALSFLPLLIALTSLVVLMVYNNSSKSSNAEKEDVYARASAATTDTMESNVVVVLDTAATDTTDTPPTYAPSSYSPTKEPTLSPQIMTTTATNDDDPLGSATSGKTQYSGLRSTNSPSSNSPTTNSPTISPLSVSSTMNTEMWGFLTTTIPTTPSPVTNPPSTATPTTASPTTDPTGYCVQEGSPCPNKKDDASCCSNVCVRDAQSRQRVCDAPAPVPSVTNLSPKQEDNKGPNKDRPHGQCIKAGEKCPTKKEASCCSDTCVKSSDTGEKICALESFQG